MAIKKAIKNLRRAGYVAIAIVWYGSGSAIAAPTERSPEVQAPAEQAQPSQSDLNGLGSRLSQMFSPEIQSALSACTTAGGVNLATSASSGSSLTCGDGSTVDVAYASYLDTASNFFAASLLLGMSQAASSEPRLTPMTAGQFFAGEGASVMRQGLQNAIARSSFVSTDSPASAELLIGAIVQEATATLNSLDSFSALLGTPEQSSFVVTNFCTSPGMSIAQAQQSTPQLRPAQLYAICLNEAGLSGTLGN